MRQIKKYIITIIIFCLLLISQNTKAAVGENIAMPWIDLLLLDNGATIIKGIKPAADPEDPLLCSIEFEDGNEYGFRTFDMYQIKDETGAERRFSNLYIAGEANPYKIVHDNEGRVETIYAPDGSAINLKYTNDTLYINYITSDKQIGILMMPIEDELKDKLDELENYKKINSKSALAEVKPKSENGTTNSRTVKEDRDNDVYPKKFIVPFYFPIRVSHYAPPGYLAGVVKIDGAKVSYPDVGITLEYVGTSPEGFNHNTGKQEDYIWIRGTKEIILEYEDVKYLKKDCEGIDEKLSDGLGESSIGLAIVGLGCIPFALNPIGVAAGALSIAFAAIDRYRDKDCESFIDRLLVANNIEEFVGNSSIEEFEVEVEPYSFLYDITFAEPIKVKTTLKCLLLWGNPYWAGVCDPYSEKEYPFTYSLKDDYTSMKIPCDNCPEKKSQLKTIMPHKQSSRNSVTIDLGNGEGESDISSMNFVPPGNEGVCKVNGPENTPPEAHSQSVNIKENTSETITLSGSDADNDPLTYTIIDQPDHGALSGTAPNLTYTPTAGYIGSDSFTFIVNDGKSDSLIAMVNINVIPAPKEYVVYTIDSWTCFEARIVTVGERSSFQKEELLCNYYYYADNTCTHIASKSEMQGGFDTREDGYEWLDGLKGEWMLNRWCPGNGYYELNGKSGWYMIF